MHRNNIIFDEYNTDDTVSLYNDFTYNIGLLETEKYLLQKYAMKDSKILDACCGAGRTAIGAYFLGFTNITGVDICNSMIKAAKCNSTQLGCNIEFKCCNILDINKLRFDFISFWFNSLMVIPNESQRKLIVQHCKNLLNKKGIIVITAPVIPDDYRYDEEIMQFSKTGYSFDFEYGDRVFDKRCFIHFPAKDEVKGYFTDMTLLENDLFDNVCHQKGRGRSLSYKELFWVYRR